MARDHRKLRVFHDAHALTLAIYRETRSFPRDEWFGLRTQLRRASVSVPSNIVEGSARRSTGEYCNFLNVARASASETQYLIGVCAELGYLSALSAGPLDERCQKVIPQQEALLQEMELRKREEDVKRGRRESREPKA